MLSLPVLVNTFVPEDILPALRAWSADAACVAGEAASAGANVAAGHATANAECDARTMSKRVRIACAATCADGVPHHHTAGGLACAAIYVDSTACKARPVSELLSTNARAGLQCCTLPSALQVVMPSAGSPLLGSARSPE